jgi:hypothetical protein
MHIRVRYANMDGHARTGHGRTVEDTGKQKTTNGNMKLTYKLGRGHLRT